MNNGQICVSICARTADAMIQKIKQAEQFADIIELRFDCLESHERAVPLKNLPNTDKKYLVTFRPKDEGGKRELTMGDRLDFWTGVLDTRRGDLMIDLESDPELLNSVDLSGVDLIVSHHNFEGPGDDLSSEWDEIVSTSEMGKMALAVNDAVDAIPLWRLIDKANKARKKIIPIAMGEAGKWTRILGLAHGAFMTYASLDEGDETAPGQITARDLIEIYRVKELDKSTEVYGVIGDPVATSLSPYIHNPAFVAERINAVFIQLMVKDLDAFMTRMVLDTREIELNFRGFAVTMPHKQAIIKYLDEIDPTAEAIGAVNTVKIDRGKLTGYNTDADGFIEPLKSRYPDLKNARAAVLGAGGAARACVFALQREKCEVTMFARDIRKAEEFADLFDCEARSLDHFEPGTFDIVVNATPVGMTGADQTGAILTAEELKGVKLVYDLVTSPPETPLIREAKIAGVQTIGGLEMLISQAAKQFEIWTGRRADIELMKRTALAQP